MAGVKISVEKLLEQEVEEISKTGEEKYIKPRSYSDELKYLSSKIDFYEGSVSSSDKSKESAVHDTPNEKENDSENKNEAKDEKQWPWDSVHSKLRLALSEMSVMLDVLQCLNRKKYLVLDQIQQNAEPNMQTVQMLEKRKYLARAGEIISKGAVSLASDKLFERDSTSFNEMKDQYYMDLMHLRQYWSVRKIGTQITGTLSYHNTGSNFWHPGLFEIKPEHNQGSNTVKRLSVTISPDLLKLSVIKIQVNDPKGKLILSSFPSASKIVSDNWNLKLKDAQCNLFNRELFSLLCNDAFKNNLTGIEVFNNGISCKILKDVTVNLELLFYEMESDQMFKNNNSGITLSLEKLLLRRFHQYSAWVKPAVSTSNNHEQLFQSSSFHNLLQKKQPENVSILKDFLDIVSINVIAERVKIYLEKKCHEIIDPVINVHWDSVTAENPSVKVLFESQCGFEKRSKCFKLFITAKTFSVIFDDSTKYNFKSSINYLDDILKWCINSHYIDVASMIAMQNYWSIRSRSPKKFLSTATDISHHAVFFNKTTCQYLSLRIINFKNIEVKVSQGVVANDDLDPEFQQLCQKYQIISCNSVRGMLFVEKCKYLFVK